MIKTKKNIVVIGGMRGISGALINSLVEEQHRVFVFGRHSQSSGEDHHQEHQINLLQLCGGQYFPYEAPEDIKSILQDQSVQEHLKLGLQGFVYTPGSIDLRPFERIKRSDFLQSFEVNTLGAIECLQAFLPFLKQNDQGHPASAVFISSIAAQIGLNFHSSVSVAKGALEGLVRALSAEYAPKIRFNAVAPSLTDTPLASRLLSNEKIRQQSVDKHPLKRIGQSIDIAQAIKFLISDESSWMTGVVLPVDGGMSSIR